MSVRPAVLIIQPELSSRIMLEMALSSDGLRVFSAASLQSALRQLRVLIADLIILDERAAARGAKAETVERIRSCSAAPILGLGDFRDQAGVGDWLPYPLNGAALSASAARLLSRVQ